MQRKRLLVLFTITVLLLNITIVSAAESKNKKNEDKDKGEKDPKEKEGNESQGKPPDKDEKDKGNNSKDSNGKEDKDLDEKPLKEKEEKDKEEKSKDGKEKPEKDKEAKNNKPEPNPGKYQFPYELHGPGTGKIKNGQEWSGDVWAHYDYNEYYGVWEVGIEGLTEEGDTAWYSFELVNNEVFENNKLEASASFIDEPFNGLGFTYEANLNSMRWTIRGEGFHFSGAIVDYSFRERGQDDYHSSVYWRDITWSAWGDTIRVTPADYLEVQVLDGETAFWGGAYGDTPEEFYSASAQWVKVSFIDGGDGEPRAGIGLRRDDGYLFVGGVELNYGEPSWRGDYPNYVICRETDNQDYELVDTGFAREPGEHTVHLIRNEDGTLDCWLDWNYITSFSGFDSEMFGQVSLLGNHDTNDRTVTFTDFEWDTGTPYMDMLTSVEFVGVFDTFYSDSNVKIVESRWSASIHEDGTAFFSCEFTELNIEEDAPGDVVGGYDYFVTRMYGDYVMDRLDGIYVIDGVMSWMKNGEFLAEIETTVYIHPDDYGNQLVYVWDTGWIHGSLLPQ